MNALAPSAPPQKAAPKFLSDAEMAAVAGAQDSGPIGFSGELNNHIRSLMAGSRDPDTDVNPYEHVSTLQGLREHTNTTPEQRRRKLEADASASHTDDPGVQGIVGGTLGAGAAALAGAAIPAAAPAFAARLLPAAASGGVSSKVQGGDFGTGALLGAGLAGIPIAKEAAGDALTSAADASLTRSAARNAASATPVKDALKAAAAKVKENAVQTIKESVGSELIGHGSAFGHAGAVLSAATRLGIPIAKAGAIAADEGAAALLRRFGRVAPGIEEAAAGSPQIEVLKDALKTATPKQAEVIKAAISGLEKRAAAGAKAASVPYAVAPESQPTGPTDLVPVPSAPVFSSYENPPHPAGPMAPTYHGEVIPPAALNAMPSHAALPAVPSVFSTYEPPAIPAGPVAPVYKVRGVVKTPAQEKLAEAQLEKFVRAANEGNEFAFGILQQIARRPGGMEKIAAVNAAIGGAR